MIERTTFLQHNDWQILTREMYSNGFSTATCRNVVSFARSDECFPFVWWRQHEWKAAESGFIGCWLETKHCAVWASACFRQCSDSSLHSCVHRLSDCTIIIRVDERTCKARLTTLCLLRLIRLSTCRPKYSERISWHVDDCSLTTMSWFSSRCEFNKKQKHIRYCRISAKVSLEQLTSFRHLEAQDFGSIATIVSTDFEAMYAFKHGDNQHCLQLCTQNVRMLLFSVSMSDMPTCIEFFSCWMMTLSHWLHWQWLSTASLDGSPITRALVSWLCRCIWWLRVSWSYVTQWRQWLRHSSDSTSLKSRWDDIHFGGLWISWNWSWQTSEINFAMITRSLLLYYTYNLERWLPLEFRMFLDCLSDRYYHLFADGDLLICSICWFLLLNTTNFQIRAMRQDCSIRVDFSSSVSCSLRHVSV